MDSKSKGLNSNTRAISCKSYIIQELQNSERLCNATVTYWTDINQFIPANVQQDVLEMLERVERLYEQINQEYLRRNQDIIEHHPHQGTFPQNRNKIRNQYSPRNQKRIERDFIFDQISSYSFIYIIIIFQTYQYLYINQRYLQTDKEGNYNCLAQKCLNDPNYTKFYLKFKIQILYLDLIIHECYHRTKRNITIKNCFIYKILKSSFGIRVIQKYQTWIIFLILLISIIFMNKLQILLLFSFFSLIIYQLMRTPVPNTKSKITGDDPHFILEWIHVLLIQQLKFRGQREKNQHDLKSNDIYDKVKKIKAFLDGTKNTILQENLLVFQTQASIKNTFDHMESMLTNQIKLPTRSYSFKSKRKDLFKVVSFQERQIQFLNNGLLITFNILIHQRKNQLSCLKNVNSLSNKQYNPNIQKRFQYGSQIAEADLVKSPSIRTNIRIFLKKGISIQRVIDFQNKIFIYIHIYYKSYKINHHMYLNKDIKKYIKQITYSHTYLLNPMILNLLSQVNKKSSLTLYNLSLFYGHKLLNFYPFEQNIKNNEQLIQFNIQHLTFNIQHLTFNIQHLTFNIQHLRQKKC
ncbi:hypothetical protein pb186bvf_019178 [Paramecium bursaria]